MIPDDLKNQLYHALRHGDDDHQRWLKEAIYDFFDGKEVKPSFGLSHKQILLNEIEELKRQLKEKNQ